MGHSKFTKIIILVIVLVAGFFAYRFFFLAGPEPEPEGLNSLNYSGEDGQAATDEFIALINELQSVDLKTDLFANPAFLALKNFGKPLIPEPKGRVNPFLPISSVIRPVSTTTTATSTATSTRR